jgi:hypothetical protein
MRTDVWACKAGVPAVRRIAGDCGAGVESRDATARSHARRALACEAARLPWSIRTASSAVSRISRPAAVGVVVLPPE